MLSRQTILETRNNNYTKIAAAFKKRTGLDFTNGYDKKIAITKSCTIVIPFYKDCLVLKKCLTALQNQDIPPIFKQSKMEIIIIDDGSSINIGRLKNTVQQTQQVLCPVTYLQLKKNYGGAVARNLGLLYAQNEIVVFLDSDIITHNHFLGSHLVRHQFTSKCIVVGFNHNISSLDTSLRLNVLRKGVVNTPDYKKDFRYKRFVPNGWKNIFANVPLKNFGRTWHPLKDSNRFKNFGQGKVIGVWDLPFMFLTGNASVYRKHILQVGGFDMRFKGVGLEDTHLGAKLISSGLFLVPNLHATAYHTIKKTQKNKRTKEFNRNFKLYTKLKSENMVYFNGNEWREKMKKYFKDKFRLISFSDPKESIERTNVLIR